MMNKIQHFLNLFGISVIIMGNDPAGMMQPESQVQIDPVLPLQAILQRLQRSGQPKIRRLNQQIGRIEMGDRFLCLCHHLPPFLPIFIIFTSVAQVIISQQIVNILRHPYFRSLHLQLPRSLEPSLLLSWNCRKCSGIFRPILCFFDGRSYQKCDIRRSWTHQTYTCRQRKD